MNRKEKLLDELEAVRQSLFYYSRSHPEFIAKIEQLEEKDRRLCRKIIELENCEHYDCVYTDGSQQCLDCEKVW